MNPKEQIRFPKEKEGRIMKLLDDLEEDLSFLIKLTLDERCALPKLDEDREEFTRRAIEIGSKRKELLPPFTDIEDLDQKLDLRRRLKVVFFRVNELCEKLDDTIIHCGSDAYVTALTIKKAIDNIRDMDGEANQYSEELKELFEPWEYPV